MLVRKSLSDECVAYLLQTFKFTQESIEGGAFTKKKPCKVEKIVESPLDSPTDDLIDLLNDSLDPSISHQGHTASIIFIRASSSEFAKTEKVFAYKLRFPEPYRY